MYFAVVGIVAGYATVASMATERIAPNARFCISFDGTYAKSVQPSQCRMCLSQSRVCLIYRHGSFKGQLVRRLSERICK
jgi:hypothetical protein